LSDAVAGKLEFSFHYLILGAAYNLAENLVMCATYLTSLIQTVYLQEKLLMPVLTRSAAELIGTF